MMTNLFSMFDPSTSYMSMTWITALLPIILMKTTKMKKSNKISKSIMIIKSKISEEMSNLLSSSSKKSSNKLITMTFMMIFSINMLAMFPYNFTSTAHISISLSMAMIMWMSVMLMGWTKSFKNMMAHMTPTGTPIQLMNFMVLIEMVSNLIRPITLSVRLSANMVAGHLLLSLLSNFSLMSYQNMLMSMLPLLVLTMLELAVSMIQAYVFVTLMTLYHKETM